MELGNDGVLWWQWGQDGRPHDGDDYENNAVVDANGGDNENTRSDDDDDDDDDDYENNDVADDNDGNIVTGKQIGRAHV